MLCYIAVKFTMANLIKKILARKILSGAIALILIAGGYFGYAKIFSDDGAIRYAIAQVQNGTLIVSVSGSGQVSASNQLDVKSKANGEITAVYAKAGEEAGARAILAAIDSRDAERAVRDAETALETAKLELDKILEPVDALALLQAENSLTQAKESKQKSEDDLKKAYEDGFNTVANAFLELPDLMTGLYDMLFSSALGVGGQWNIDYYADSVKTYDEKSLQYKEDARVAYQKARTAYDKNFDDYKSASRFSDAATIEKLIDQTYGATKDIAEAVKDAGNLILFHKDKLIERNLKPAVLADAHLSTLNTYTGKTNSNLLGLLSVQRAVKDSKEAIISADRAIEERELSLAKTKEGPDDLDIRAKKITVQQKEDAFITAKQTLADHYVRAPFSGVVAKVNAKKGDSASPGTAIATLVTKQKIAEISLNEIDVAKIKTGQKVALTFDAVPELTITGQVAEVDAVGTVSQGVVTYVVKIGFDTQDDRVKTAMSVSASVITEEKQNVLLIPNSAVKSFTRQNFSEQNLGGQGAVRYYIEIVDDNDRNLALAANVSGAILKNTPRRQPVEIGIANDEFTEIISGLQEGDVIVTRTVQSTLAQTTQAQQNPSIRIPGLPAGGTGRSGGGFNR